MELTSEVKNEILREIRKASDKINESIRICIQKD